MMNDVASEDVVANAASNNWPWQVPLINIDVDADQYGSNNWPRITIVTPSFNQGSFLEETIRSVVFQGYPNLEYIIIDGGSTDCSVDIIRRYETKITYWISEPDRGQCHALNKGFSMATGDWFAWLNSDDVFVPGALWMVAKTILSHAGCNWVVGAVDFTDVDLKSIGIFKPVCNTDDWLDFVCTKRKNGTALPQSGSFWSHRAWGVAGQLDETLHFAMDHEYWGRLAYHGFRPVCFQQSIALFRQHPQAKTARGDANFIVDEQKVIDNWIGKVSATDSQMLINYRRTLRFRFLLRHIQCLINSCLAPLHVIARHCRMALK